MEQLEDRVAVVTGASTGIGRSIAKSFLDAGLKVVAASQNSTRLDEAVAELRAHGEVIGVPTDVSDLAAVQRLAHATLDAFGAVHVLVNNHGVVGLSKSLRADLELKGANVGVTLVCPGAVKTEITSQIENTGPGGVPRGTVDLAPEVQARWDSIAAYTDAGIPADDAGEMVVAAVRDNRFWVLPNGEVFFPIFDQELADLKAGR